MGYRKVTQAQDEKIHDCNDNQRETLRINRALMYAITYRANEIKSNSMVSTTEK